jgi:hypothetical protein
MHPRIHASVAIARPRAVSILAVALLLSAFASASAQTTPAAPLDASSTDPGWLKVETLELGRRLHVNTKQHTHVDCLFAKADAETLTCGGVVFQKAEIKSIKPSHRVRSTFAGLGTGYLAAGAIAAVAFGGSSHQIVGSDRCNSAGCVITVAIVDVAVLIVTPIVFHAFDLTATSIYKAP